MDTGKSLAELAAMRAKGQLTDKEFDEAKRLLLKQDNSARKFKNPNKDNKPGCRRVLVAMFFVIGGIWLIGALSDKDKSGSSQTTRNSVADTSKEDADRRRKGFHCLSSWDGSHRDFIQELKKNLRDPSSFEHSETRITPVSAKGEHTVVMEYRAKNGFGGMNIGVATATISSSDCGVISWETVSN